MTRPPSTALVWFGALGGALAWATQFVVGVMFTWAKCNAPQGRWELAVQAWQFWLAVAGVVIGLAATAVCVRLYRQTRALDHVAATERLGEGSPPPVGRINFLATTGLLVNVLALSIMMMTAVGVPLLNLCQQS